ncbi:SDR family NAD(P)-dependent oxidoreductase [Sphingobium boeckii]|uniref:NAD(P)-dependent dehydrogenase (Short-subunit alcohol dehydrogenase family) n=1 Tax=Sphingobium boeckii TaxID=1082345 RepID=A0A7W9AEI4_9SPHN|nr:SDR family oxidoreductase [Sphingobium boeckii]MBB5684135.1 NAD(P)-dependent dehydrogenase (short-subunit alcohol dehydrogenase family) [Sphingobium boeckii]
MISMNKKLEGKVVLVAGAGGIGNALAIRYAEEGAKIVLGDIELATAEEAAHQISVMGGEAIALRLDGADEASVASAVSTCCDTFARLDGAHINFGFLADGNPQIGVLELPIEIYDETQRVNARGFYLCTRAVLPRMIEGGGGSIVYTSSAVADAPSPAQVAYAMSKAAGHALMRHVATRFGAQGIRANTIAPAMTIHARIEKLVPPEMIEWARSAAAIKARVGRPDDIAAMGALLLSDDGSYITGQVISIDGGTTMRP